MFGMLRTLLAINVVLLHIFNVPTLGNYSVSFFFLLSGFLMTLIMHETYGYSIKGFKTFWINRFLRLYPIYFLILILSICMLFLFPSVIKHPDMFVPKTLMEWFANISMIYPNFIPHRFEPRLSPPSWALTNELFFYLLIALGISKTKLRTFLWLLFSIGYYVGTYLYYDIATYRYSAIFASSLPFALGAFLYWFNKAYSIKRVSYILLLALYTLFIVNAIYSTSFTPIIKEYSIYFNMIIAFFLIYFLFNFKAHKRLKKMDTYLGYYSYPIYLSHYVIAILYAGIIGYGIVLGSFKMYFSAFIPYFLLLILFCWLVVHLIDIKINKYKMKLKIKKYST